MPNNEPTPPEEDGMMGRADKEVKEDEVVATTERTAEETESPNGGAELTEEILLGEEERKTESPNEGAQPQEGTAVRGGSPRRAGGNIASIRSALAEVTKGKQMRKIAKDLISTTKPLLLDVKSFGLDLDAEKDIFRDGIKAIKAEDYIRGCQLIVKVKKRLESKKEEYLLEKTSDSLGKVPPMFDQAREVGIDVTETKDKFGEFRERLANKDFDDPSEFNREVEEFTEHSVSQLEELMKNKLAEIVPNEIEAVKPLLSEAEEVQADIEDESAKLSAAESLLGEENYKEAYENLRDLRSGLRNKIDHRLKERDTERLEEAREILSRLKGSDRSPLLKETIDRAEDALEQGEFNNVNAALEEFEGLRKEAESALSRNRYLGKLDEIKGDLDQLVGVGIEVPGSEQSIRTVEGALEEGEFGKAEADLIALREKVNKAKTTDARKVASSLLADVKQTYNKLREAEVDIEEVKGDFRKGITAIKSQNFVEGCDLLGKSKEALEALDTEYMKETLTARLEEALAFHASIGEMEFITADLRSDVKELLDRAEELIGNGELIEAQSKLDEFVETREDIADRIEIYEKAAALSENVAELRGSAEELSIDMGYVDELLAEGKGQMGEYFFEEAIVTFQEAEELLNAKIKGEMEARATSELQRAAEFFEEIKGSYERPEEVEELLVKAQEAIAQREFESSVEISRGVIERLEEAQEKELSSRIRGMFAEFQKLTTECDELGLEVLRAEALEYKAKVAFENDKLMRSLELAQEAQQLAEDKKESFLKEQAEKVLSELDRLLARGIELETEVTDIEEMKLRGGELFGNGEFVEARGVFEEARVPLKERINEKLVGIIKEQSSVLSQKMREAKELELEIGSEREALSAISELKEEKRYDDVLDTLLDIQTGVQERITNKYREMSGDKAEEIGRRLEELREEGCDVARAEEILERARTMRDEGDFKAALDVLDESVEVAGELWKEHRKDRIRQFISTTAELLSEIIDVMGGEVDLSAPTDKLDMAGEALKTEDFETAKRVADEARSQADRVYYQYVIDSLLVAHDKLLEVRNLGGDVSEAQIKFSHAKSFLEKKKYSRAIDGAKEVMELTEEAKQDFMSDEIEKNRKVVVSIASKLKEKDVDIEELREKLDRVSTKMDEEDIEAAFELSKEARKLAASYRDDYKKDTVRSVIETSDKLVEELEELGVDNSDVAEELREARDLLEEKKYSQSLKIAKRTEGVLNKRYKKHYNELLSARIEEAGEHIEKVGERADVTEALGTLDQAREELEKDKFEKCNNLIEQAKQQANKLSHTSLVIKAANVLSYTGDLINDSVREGLSVTRLRPKLIEASDAFENKGYQRTIDICATIGGWIEKAKIDKLSEAAKNALKEAKASVERAKEINADVGEPVSSYKEAMKEYKSKNFSKSLALAEEVSELSKYQEDLRAVTAVVDSVRNKLDEIKDGGIDVEEAEGIFSGAEEALRSDDFEKAGGMARESIQKAMAEYKFNEMNQKIERSREYVAFALGNDIFIKDYLSGPLEAEETEGQCPNCGNEVPEKAMFCLWCGHKLKANE